MNRKDERRKQRRILRTNMEHGRRELNVTKMSRAFLWTLFASLTVVLTINCTEARVVDTLSPRPLTLIVLLVT